IPIGDETLSLRVSCCGDLRVVVHWPPRTGGGDADAASHFCCNGLRVLSRRAPGSASTSTDIPARHPRRPILYPNLLSHANRHQWHVGSQFILRCPPDVT